MYVRVVFVVKVAFSLIDYPIYFRMDLSTLYFNGLPVKISIKLCIFVPEIHFYLRHSVDPDVIPPYAALNLGLHCLP